MEGNIYAFTMILMLAGTIVALKIAGMRPRLRSIVLGAAIALLLFFALAVLVPSHACRRGEPVNAALLSALLSGVVVASIRRPVTCIVAVTTLNQVAGQDVIPSPPSYRWGAVSSYWHTRFTGIYCLDVGRKGIWCSGGPIAACTNRLEGRERR